MLHMWSNKMLQNNFYTSRVFIRCSYVHSTQQICCEHLIWHDVSAEQIPRMTLYNFRSCRVSPLSEFLNVLATKITGQMSLNTGGNCKVSPQCKWFSSIGGNSSCISLYKHLSRSAADTWFDMTFEVTICCKWFKTLHAAVRFFARMNS